MTQTAIRAAALSPARLSQLVSSVAASPDCWHGVLRFMPGRRWFCRLDLTSDYEVWLLSWLPGQATGFHDHGDAAGAFALARGCLQERMAAVGRASVRSRLLSAPSVRSFGSAHLHDVRNTSAEPAVSVHAYSPPLSAMRRYQLTPVGLVQTGTDAAGGAW